MDYPRFIRSLYDIAAPADHCPHLVAPDDRGCRCRMAEQHPLIGTDHRCDGASLQLWCLAGPKRWPACALYVPVAETIWGRMPIGTG